jgi:hypothetical protein
MALKGLNENYHNKEDMTGKNIQQICRDKLEMLESAWRENMAVKLYEGCKINYDNCLALTT